MKYALSLLAIFLSILLMAVAADANSLLGLLGATALTAAVVVGAILRGE